MRNTEFHTTNRTGICQWCFTLGEGLKGSEGRTAHHRRHRRATHRARWTTIHRTWKQLPGVFGIYPSRPLVPSNAKKKEALKAKDSIEIHRVITDEYKKETCKTSKIVFELNEGDTKVLYTDGYDVPYRMVHITSGKYNKYFQLKNRPALTTIQAHSSGDMPYLAAVGLIGRHSGGTWTMYKALTAVFPSEFISCIGKQGHSIR